MSARPLCIDDVTHDELAAEALRFIRQDRVLAILRSDGLWASVGQEVGNTHPGLRLVYAQMVCRVEPISFALLGGDITDEYFRPERRLDGLAYASNEEVREDACIEAPRADDDCIGRIDGIEGGAVGHSVTRFHPEVHDRLMGAADSGLASQYAASLSLGLQHDVCRPSGRHDFPFESQ